MPLQHDPSPPTHPGGVYRAAVPGYPANFSRDSLTYGLLADDLPALRAQLAFSARHQGRRPDPETGEEPGKVHHELPGAELRGLWTTYNACDTTALFVIALDRLHRRGDRGALHDHRESLDRALVYLSEHLYDDVFYEDTRQSGAQRFALKVTYWKDSELNSGDGPSEPLYPVSYALTHFQCQAALRAAARLTGRGELQERATAMVRRGFEVFWRGDHFAAAVLGDGSIVDAPSSDSLHALLYLHPSELEPGAVERIAAYSEQLATGVGYLTALGDAATRDDYHTRWVWAHEQALLHAAARRHGLAQAEEVAERAMPVLDRSFPELIDPETGEPAGNELQLWAVGAHVYFQRVRVAKALGALD